MMYHGDFKSDLFAFSFRFPKLNSLIGHYHFRVMSWRPRYNGYMGPAGATSKGDGELLPWAEKKEATTRQRPAGATSTWDMGATAWGREEGGDDATKAGGGNFWSFIFSSLLYKGRQI